MGSVRQNSRVVTEYLAEERRTGRVFGPVDDHRWAWCISNGSVSSPSRISQEIVDLSHPSGASVSNGMDNVLCSLTYASLDNAVELILEAGRGAYLGGRPRCLAH